MIDVLKVGILGATGMVGQKFIVLLDKHPWFKVTAVAASSRSAGKKYSDAVKGRWVGGDIPASVKDLQVTDVSEMDMDVDFVFSAIDASKEEIRSIEDKYAEAGIPVVSNNSAHRWTKDVPMIIPEINPGHIKLIDVQKKNHGWTKGFVVVKPNCSLQSYLPAIFPLMGFKPSQMIVTTMQAISGAGKTFDSYPDILDNVIPNIGGEEEKSEKEPLKILGKVGKDCVEEYKGLSISAHCNRVPVSDGHMATVSVKFDEKVSSDEILSAWKAFNPLAKMGLPSSPSMFLEYFDDSFRPQTKLDRDNGKGMGISLGRLRKCNVLDYRFVALSHNTVRGAAGGAILVAELLKKEGFLG